MGEVVKRKFAQGLRNVVKFNWHFYVLSGSLILLCLGSLIFFDGALKLWMGLFALALSGVVLVSLAVTFYVYDLSNFYGFEWLKDEKIKEHGLILNLSAGFDETSVQLTARFSHAKHQTMDFYHSLNKKEVSIQRAQKAYPLAEHTLEIDLTKVPLPDGSVDKIFAIFALHEIRGESQRVCFFKELKRMTQDHGQLIVVEHVRDAYNLMAYNIGAFHFLSRSCWLRTFTISGWSLTKTIKHTPFVSVFILEK